MTFRVAHAVVGLLGGVVTASRYTLSRCQSEGLPMPSIDDVIHDSALSVSSSTFKTKTWGTTWDYQWDLNRNSTVDGSEVVGGGSNSLSRQLTRSYQRQIILVRHGQYQNESNKEKKDNERTLTKLGQEQARQTGRFLYEALSGRSALFVKGCIDAVHVSDLTRARQTAELLLEAFPEDVRSKMTIMAPDPLLREKFPCDPEPPYPKRAKPKHMMASEQAFENYFYRPQVPSPSGAEPDGSGGGGGGESIAEVKRLELLVGHGNMIRYFVCRGLQLPPEAWLRLAIPHCSITLLTINGHGEVKLTAYGTFTHFPPHMQTISNLAKDEV